MAIRSYLPVVALLALTVAQAQAQVPPPDAVGLPEQTEDSQTDELTAARRGRDALTAAADFSGALVPAERSLELALASDAPNRESDFVQLARIQSELGQHEEAETNYLAAIDLLEEREGQNSMMLIEPYHGLGRNYINSRRFAEAVTVLEHARDISQRNTGLFNIEQSMLIDDITLALLGQGDTTAARELQLARLENAVRRFGADDPRTVPFYQHLGEYYDSSRLRVSAREQYQKALDILDSQPDTDQAMTLESLRRLVQIELMLGDSDAAKLRLEQALAGSPEPEPLDRGLSLALLADYALVQEDFESAARYYAQAYAALGQQEQVDADEYFGQPTMIDFVAPLSAVDMGRRSDPYAWGTIVLEFDVNSMGRVENVRTARIEPSNDGERAYTRRLRETHFRPRLEGGVPVATNNVELSHFFRYYVRERRRR